MTDQRTSGLGEDGVVVLGAGIVGLCSALALRRAGRPVLLIDAGEPGAGCSFGNGGMIQVGSSLPLAMPGILRRSVAMLTDPEGALTMRWKSLPGLMPWALRFLAEARPDRVAENERRLATLLAGARGAWERLTAGTPAATTFRSRGELYVVRSAAAFAGFDAKIEAGRRNGVAIEILDADGIRAMEPLLSPGYTHGLHLPGSGYVVDPQLLSRQIFDLFLAEGGSFETARIVRLGRDGDGRPELFADDGRRFGAGRLLVAAGSASADLSRQIGPRLPIEGLRGYHITLPASATRLSGPVIEGEMNIAVTPMLDGDRVAGTLEFAGRDPAPSWRRAEMLLPLALRMVPSLTGTIANRWFGDRPGTPDTLPILGPRRGDDRIWWASGHGMLGLTLAAETARLIAAAMSGEPSARAALAPYAPDRFDTSRTPWSTR